MLTLVASRLAPRQARSTAIRNWWILQQARHPEHNQLQASPRNGVSVAHCALARQQLADKKEKTSRTRQDLPGASINKCQVAHRLQDASRSWPNLSKPWTRHFSAGSSHVLPGPSKTLLKDLTWASSQTPPFSTNTSKAFKSHSCGGLGSNLARATARKRKVAVERGGLANSFLACCLCS